jgi:prefoldin subunit 5
VADAAGVADAADAAVPAGAAAPVEANVEQKIKALELRRKDLKRQLTDATKALKVEKQKRSRVLQSARTLSVQDLAFLLAKKADR